MVCNRPTLTAKFTGTGGASGQQALRHPFNATERHAEQGAATGNKFRRHGARDWLIDIRPALPLQQNATAEGAT